ncbi:host factor-I protein [Paenibacillus sophorae]|uniref:RNA chaperone Hfq n=2 Tax=Paenibacillus TaxID=44249 RepID=A0A089HL59_PAEDU|nr:MULTISPECIES: RNA chaperone Hfq [Paenibacillus]AIQ12706.1 RNA chaperone Hfq [Paenibacillus durus]QWU13520.1 RNA chaperone Hfq [Paenibacillus sophorae]SEN85375.1 host factor-I protein [Paenibacillus sophorae]
MEIQKLQERLLSQFVQTKVPLTIFTTNGVKIQGILTAYDAYTLTLQGQNDGRQNVLFKSAVSTIVPLRPVSLR